MTRGYGIILPHKAEVFNMICYAYGINHMDSEKSITPLYTGPNEEEAITIAKSRLTDFADTVVKGLGSGVLYHSNNSPLKDQRHHKIILRVIDLGSVKSLVKFDDNSQGYIDTKEVPKNLISEFKSLVLEIC